MDVLQHTLHTRPDTKWAIADISNVTIYVNKMPSIYIGAPPEQQLPEYIANNKGLDKLIRNRHSGARYKDNFCLFRCFARKEGNSSISLETCTKHLVDRYKEVMNEPPTKGICLEDLHHFEKNLQ